MKPFLALSAVQTGPAAAAGTAFDPAQVIDIARTLSRKAYRPRPTIPQDWLDLTYEDYRQIWPRPDAGLWAASGREAHGT